MADVGNIDKALESIERYKKSQELAKQAGTPENVPALGKTLSGLRARPSIVIAKAESLPTDTNKAQENINEYNRKTTEKALEDARKDIDKLELMLVFKPSDKSIKDQLDRAKEREGNALKTLAEFNPSTLDKSQKSINDYSNKQAQERIQDARNTLARFNDQIGPVDPAQQAIDKFNRERAEKQLQQASMDARTTSDGVVSRSFGTPKFDNPNS